MLRHLFIMMIMTIVVCQATSQRFGIRAGLNYTKFSGPTEEGVNEKFSLANGFHFGVNYAYKFAEDFSVKGELLYTQIGTNYSYEGRSYYRVPLSNAFIAKTGQTKINMKVSNAYISVPITLQWELSKKVEVFAGAYASFLIGPKGTGTMEFVHSNDSLFFQQGLIHNYYKDVARGSSNPFGPSVWVNGKVTRLARDAGAYYNMSEADKTGNLYRVFDFGLTGGANYFINKGFYVGLRYDIGLRDVTNDDVDFLKNSYDEANNLGIKAKHFDTNVGFQASFGFRF
jgi:Outer membrane protein beta-barrel domain